MEEPLDSCEREQRYSGICKRHQRHSRCHQFAFCGKRKLCQGEECDAGLQPAEELLPKSRNQQPASVCFRTESVPLHKLQRTRSEEHTSELQSRQYLVCRLLLEKK